MSDKHAGMTLSKIAAQAATSGECELTKFAFSCVRFEVHPSAMQLYEGHYPTAEAGANLSTPKR